MKKKQKEQIKAGGEIARARYQEFLKKPQWLHGLNNEEKRLAREVLHDAFMIEMKMFEIQKHKSTEAMCEHAMRVSMAAKLGVVVDYINGPDIAIYSRDN